MHIDTRMLIQLTVYVFISWSAYCILYDVTYVFPLVLLCNVRDAKSGHCFSIKNVFLLSLMSNVLINYICQIWKLDHLLDAILQWNEQRNMGNKSKKHVIVA